ncbi:MAG: Cys-tRNA(Pro) deacylase [Proteobacteria bacterium]|nr:Cys-tRNA(Pro) deacylase [Pseudomonadota bacterium]
MTPAVNLVKKQKIDYSLHSYKPGMSSTESYGEEAAEALGLDKNQVFKTLVTALNGNKRTLGIALVPVSTMLDLKQFAKAAEVKNAEMAQPADAQRTTGYILGGISPLGQKQKLPTVIDASLKNFDTVFVSAGKRGLQLELAPEDLIKLTNAKVGVIAK